jgi:hypothetical protein
MDAAGPVALRALRTPDEQHRPDWLVQGKVTAGCIRNAAYRGNRVEWEPTGGGHGRCGGAVMRGRRVRSTPNLREHLLNSLIRGAKPPVGSGL